MAAPAEELEAIDYSFRKSPSLMVSYAIGTDQIIITELNKQISGRSKKGMESREAQKKAPGDKTPL